MASWALPEHARWFLVIHLSANMATAASKKRANYNTVNCKQTPRWHHSSLIQDTVSGREALPNEPRWAVREYQRSEDDYQYVYCVSLSSPVHSHPHSHPAGQFDFMCITHHSKRREAKEHFFSSQCCLIQSDFIMTRTERIFKHSFDLKLMELRVWNENLKLNELWGKNSWARHLLLANIRDAVQQQSLNSDRCVGEARKGNISEYAGEEAGQKEYRAKHCSSRWRRNITYPH